jgi:hypothetical protein
MATRFALRRRRRTVAQLARAALLACLSRFTILAATTRV